MSEPAKPMKQQAVELFGALASLAVVALFCWGTWAVGHSAWIALTGEGWPERVSCHAGGAVIYSGIAVDGLQRPIFGRRYVTDAVSKVRVTFDDAAVCVTEALPEPKAEKAEATPRPAPAPEMKEAEDVEWAKKNLNDPINGERARNIFKTHNIE